MADSITLDALMQSKGHTALQVQKPASVEAVRAQVEELSPEQKARVEEVKNSIDLMDSQAALQYGVGAQRNISSFSDNILTQVRSKDSGYVGELMSDLVLKVKEVDVDGLDEGFWDKIPFLKNASRAVKKFMQRYEKLEVQIDRIEQQLDQARMQMLKDITMFDGLYEKNLEYFRELQIYIAAGEEKLQELQETTLPQLRAEAAAKGDAMSAQVVRDFEDTVNRFEKKIHDLKLSKTVAIQTAPQIRLIQNNDKMLVDKIQTAILSTIPLWKSQIVIALGLHRLFGLVLGGQPGVVVHGVADDVAIVVLGVQAGLVVIGVRIRAVASGASMIGKDDLVCWFLVLLNAPITNGKSPLFIISHRYRKRVNTGVILDTV